MGWYLNCDILEHSYPYLYIYLKKIIKIKITTNSNKNIFEDSNRNSLIPPNLALATTLIWNLTKMFSGLLPQKIGIHHLEHAL